jgi:hypothetical protein
VQARHHTPAALPGLEHETGQCEDEAQQRRDHHADTDSCGTVTGVGPVVAGAEAGGEQWVTSQHGRRHDGGLHPRTTTWQQREVHGARQAGHAHREQSRDLHGRRRRASRQGQHVHGC